MKKKRILAGVLATLMVSTMTLSGTAVCGARRRDGAGRRGSGYPDKRSHCQHQNQLYHESRRERSSKLWIPQYAAAPGHPPILSLQR